MLINASRKMKLLLIGFLFAGVLIALMSSLLVLTFDDRNNQIYYPKEQLMVSLEGSNSFLTVKNKLKDDEAIIFGSDDRIAYDGVVFNQATYYGDLGPNAGIRFIPAHINKATIIYGRDIEDKKGVKEITIDKMKAREFLFSARSYLSTIGYKEADLVGMTVKLNDESYKIVGITNYNHNLTRINYDNFKILMLRKYPSLGDKTDDELIEMFNNNDAVLGFDMIKNISISVFTKTPKETKKSFEEMNIKVLNDYEQEHRILIREKNKSVGSIVATILVISALIWLSLYFIIRSNLFSRIDEIKVYRALGVKRFEIVKIYLVEVIVLTTATSLIGFLITMYIIIKNDFLGNINMVMYSPIQIALAILFMYTFNIIFGTLPVGVLLRKTPAAIIASAEV